MKPRQIFLLLVIFFCNEKADAQNLIQNGSFEDLKSIPQFFGQIRLAKGWTNMSAPTIIGESPDLFHVNGYTPRDLFLSIGNISTLPQEGKAFVGLIMNFSLDFSREYITYEFTEKVAPGKYKFSYYYTNGTISSSRQTFSAINCIQVHFSKDIIYHNSGLLYIENPTIPQNTILKSENTWSKIEYELEFTDSVAAMTVGNFCKVGVAKEDTLILGNPLYDLSRGGAESYYFFDNFVLEKLRKPLLGDTLYEACKGQEIDLKIKGDKNNKWYNSKKQLLAQNIESFVIQADSNTIYTVIGTTDTLKIKVVAKPNPKKIIESVIKICTPLVFEYKNEAYDSVKISPTLENNTFTENGKYTISTWLEGCSRVDTCLYEIEDCQVELEYPNIFTPNMDNRNDVFKPLKIKNIAKAELIVYNRWGKEVFFTEKTNLSWDGAGVNAGVYFYICKYIDRFGKENAVNGWVIIAE